MAIAFDAASGIGYEASANSITLSHTCTGNERLLIVGVTTRANTGADIITGVTYNSVAMTRINTAKESGASSDDDRLYLYYLIAPDTGTHNIVASASATGVMYIRGASYTGCRQENQPDNYDSAVFDYPTANITKALTPNVNNCWLVGVADNGFGAFVAGTGTTIRSTGIYTSRAYIDNNGAINPAASTALSVTVSGNSNGVILIASIAPPITPTTNYLEDYRGMGRG